MRLVKKCLLGMSLMLTAAGSVWAESDSYQRGLERYNRSDWIGAMPYFEQASEEGVVEAQRRLGYILWKGGADNQQAGRWLRAAAEAGDADAKVYYLSLMSENADNELARTAEARAWLEQQSEQSDGAKYILARSYDGDDDAQALKLYRELADAGWREAVIRLIKAYRNGELGLVVDPDKVEALKEQLK